MQQLPTTPSFRLDGRRALVTGASSGIGLAAAVALAEARAHVVMAARRPEPNRVAWLKTKIKLGRVGEVEDILATRHSGRDPLWRWPAQGMGALR